MMKETGLGQLCGLHAQMGMQQTQRNVAPGNNRLRLDEVVDRMVGHLNTLTHICDGLDAVMIRMGVPAAANNNTPSAQKDGFGILGEIESKILAFDVAASQIESHVDALRKL